MDQEQDIERDWQLVAAWRSAGHDEHPAGSPPQPDPGDLALWRDGLLDGDACEVVETALACDPDLLNHVLAGPARLVPAAVSADLVARLQALVPAPAASAVVALAPAAPRPAAFRRGFARRLRAPAAFQWGALAASIALVALMGFDLGLVFDRSLASLSGSAPGVDVIDAESAGRG